MNAILLVLVFSAGYAFGPNDSLDAMMLGYDSVAACEAAKIELKKIEPEPGQRVMMECVPMTDQ